jgi:hypothetical protein
LAIKDDAPCYFAIVALRTHVPSIEHLVNHIVIGYFRDGEGTPPDAPNYHSGYCIGDVLEGRSDWTESERNELREFIESEPRFRSWLEVHYADIDIAIRENAVWSSPLLQDEAENDENTANTLMRAVIQRSATDTGSMAQLRNP